MRLAPPLLLLLLAAMGVLGTAPAKAQAPPLRLGMSISVDSPTGQNIREFARQVQARTSGAVRIQIEGEDRAYQDDELLATVASGAIDIGAIPLAHFARKVPLCAAFLQPFLFNLDALTEAATGPENEIRALIEKEILSRTNTRVLWWEPYGSSIVVSEKTPANDPGTIVARPVGASDDQARELLSTCGGLSRLLSPSDVYAGLKKGTIGAAATDIMNVREHELWRVADTITNLRYAPSLFMVVINEQAWQKLEPDHQVTLTELGQDAQNYMRARSLTIRAEAYAYAVAKGMRVVELRPEDFMAWRACSASLLEKYMVRAGTPGSKLFAAYGKLRTHPCCNEVPGGATTFRPQ